MRRIARTVAASIVIILGLALISAATFSSKIETAIGPDKPKGSADSDAVAPLDPNADNGPVRKIVPNVSLFNTEFGKRGKHEVTVTVTGSAHYEITWRDDPDVEAGRGNVQRTRTINSGFPVVQVGISTRTLGLHSTCVITVDGKEKDRQSTTDEAPMQVCAA